MSWVFPLYCTLCCLNNVITGRKDEENNHGSFFISIHWYGHGLVLWLINTWYIITCLHTNTSFFFKGAICFVIVLVVFVYGFLLDHFHSNKKFEFHKLHNWNKIMLLKLDSIMRIAHYWFGLKSTNQSSRLHKHRSFRRIRTIFQTGFSQLVNEFVRIQLSCELLLKSVINIICSITVKLLLRKNTILPYSWLTPYCPHLALWPLRHPLPRVYSGVLSAGTASERSDHGCLGGRKKACILKAVITLHCKMIQMISVTLKPNNRHVSIYSQQFIIIEKFIICWYCE